MAIPIVKPNLPSPPLAQGDQTDQERIEQLESKLRALIGALGKYAFMPSEYAEQLAGTLDDIADGVSFGRVNISDLSGGSIVLSTTVGNLDDISDGSTYGRILTTDISAGHILLSSVSGDLDDVSDGVTYGKVDKTDITAGRIDITSSSISDVGANADSTTGVLSSTTIVAGQISIDTVYQDTSAGTWGLVARTSINAGQIKIAGVDSTITSLLFSDTSRKAAVESWRHTSDTTLIDGGDIYAGSSITVGNATKSGTITIRGTEGEGDSVLRSDNAGNITDFGLANPGFILGMDDSDSNKYKFEIGSTTEHFKWDGTSIIILCTGGVLGSATNYFNITTGAQQTHDGGALYGYSVGAAYGVFSGTGGTGTLHIALLYNGLHARNYSSSPEFDIKRNSGAVAFSAKVSGSGASEKFSFDAYADATHLIAMDENAGTYNLKGFTLTGCSIAASQINSGIVAVSNGGTGLNSITDHAVMVGSGAGNITAVGPGSNGQILTGATGGDPTWNSSISITGNISTSGIFVGLYLYHNQLSSDPVKPTAGDASIWASDGTGFGAAGDIIMASTVGGTTRRAVVFTYSGGAVW